MNEITRNSQFTPASEPAPRPTTQAAGGTPRLMPELALKLADLGIG